MSTAKDNKYEVNCNPSTNTCSTPDGDFRYDPDKSVVIAPNGAELPVLPTNEGMSNAQNIGDYLPGATGWIDVPEN